MQFRVVPCSCGNPQPHRRLEAEDGRRSKGFFSIEIGKKRLIEIIASGEAKQTGEETEATLQELNSCGLPATEAEVFLAKMEVFLAEMKIPGSPLSLGDDFLKIAADALIKIEPAEDHPKVIADAIVMGLLSAEDGAEILALLSKEATDEI
ncbi:MAG: hypothetical protein UT43_C0048G0004 [Parcubacteria group bacterium GW2011_GWC1_39_29]|nr:MAG: hypothetical protein UT43_C0048G0004 [Parcubacteria group bacterium GW2011_GWC1_39_29]